MITNVTNVSKIDTTSYTSKNDVSKKDTNDDNNINEALSQDLGKDTFVKSKDEDISNLTYKPVKKKLSPEEIKALKEDQANTEKDFIKKFVNDTINNQNNLFKNSTESSQETTDLLTKIFGSMEKAYPKVGTTPEEAQKAISDGGSYSVNAVADRIMTMASALAGDDKDKLQQMRDAVEKGFKQAGIDFKDATKKDALPQICKDTYTEVMKRFDALQNKTSTSDTKDTNQENNTKVNK